MLARTLELFKPLGKKLILDKLELPGFVANRLQTALVSEAFSLIVRCIVTAEEISASSCLVWDFGRLVEGKCQPLEVEVSSGNSSAEALAKVRLIRPWLAAK